MAPELLAAYSGFAFLPMAPRRSFHGIPQTRWSSVLADPARDPGHWRNRFGELFLDYHGPVSSWLSEAGLGGREPIDDLCQAFFLHLIERDVLAGFDPARGRLRDFLKGALRNFARERRRHWQALRRRVQPGSLDDQEIAASVTEGPDAAFDRAFAAAMVGKALERLAADSLEAGRTEDLALFRAHDVDGTVASYEEAAIRFGRNRDYVKNHLGAMRERFHASLLAVLRDATTNQGDALSTMRELARG